MPSIESLPLVLVVRGRQRVLDGIVTVGRSAACDIVLHRDQEASRLHARFSLRDEVAYVEDLDSTNGTFVGGERVLGIRRLELFDLVRVGSSLISLNRAELPLRSELQPPRAQFDSPVPSADLNAALTRPSGAELVEHTRPPRDEGFAPKSLS